MRTPLAGRLLAKRFCVGLVALGTLAACGGTASPPTTTAKAADGQLSRAVGEAAAYTHLEALQKIADDNGGTRVTPSPGYDASVEYVVKVLRDAGYEVSTPTYRPSSDSDSSDSDGDRARRGQGSYRNVIAQSRTGDPNRTVFLGAHLDSVKEGPGINDNGSGVAALLEIATRLGGSPNLPNAVRFAFWGSEEDGMVGSDYYVDNLSSQQRRQIMLYLNLDMVASPNAGYFVHGGRGKKNREAGPAGTATVARVMSEQLTKTGVTVQPIPFVEDSDYDPFVKAGIPSAAPFTGDEKEKTSEQAKSWGGTVDEVFDKCYHKSCDTIKNINRTALDHNIRATAATVEYFASYNGTLTE
ncbi:hypothetical protein GCM10023321_08100 [Pseudonocardia eucalypti]|uniref:Peptidase M28 domain-containing protein n=1 Tax=Pseudonocardia eucalypti TaxID=648755 RepID=A0ABP9PKQ0_9PSEU|nr:aminopeptidase S [Pseudonocardia eucalypti]